LFFRDLRDEFAVTKTKIISIVGIKLREILKNKERKKERKKSEVSVCVIVTSKESRGEV
jgi:hypothetical protein